MKRNIILAAIGTLAISACTGDFNQRLDRSKSFLSVQFSDDVDRARSLPPPGADWKAVRNGPANGNSFNANLSRDYKALMLFEYEEMHDDLSAHMYARRSLASARGEDVAPAQLADFILPASHLGALQQARADILEIFSKGSREKFPMLSARAQSSFDCWVEQQEENHQPDHIAACRDEFVADMKKLQLAMTPVPEPRVETKPMAPAPAPPAAVFKDSYTVYFALNSAVLDATALKIVDEVIRALQTQNAGASIIGHTDTLGTAKYNLSLSQRRAKAIVDRLLKAGIRPAVVTSEGRGEKNLATPTADNVNEPKNRRSVINIR